MKYTTSIEINRPIDEVVAAFDNPDNLPKWMPGLKSFTHLSGEPGQPGAKSSLVFMRGNREMEMIETITVRNLPKQFSGVYEAPGVFNQVDGSFEAIDENRTLYTQDQTFIASGIKGLPIKIMGIVAKGAFKKESMKYLENFKALCEGTLQTNTDTQR